MSITEDLDKLVDWFCDLGDGFEAKYIIKPGYDHVGLVTLIVPVE